jgi:stage II sporulation protein E
MENKKTENVGFFDGLGAMIKDGLEKRRESSSAVFYDVIVLLVSFLFSRCHIVFGAYPLGVAFVAVLPHGVWLALIGAAVGSLTLGRVGIIHAIITVVVAFLRIIISGGERNGESAIFREPLVLRISAASIGAFVGGAYEVLLRGFAFSSVLYGCCFVVLAAVFTFAFAGIFDSGISLSDVLAGKRNLFAPSKNEKERFSLYLFQATFLLFVFLISISLKGYNVFGISVAYIFSSFITLIVARRFGAVRAMTVGFVSSLGISSVYSVAFALVGLGSGILFGAGITYALAFAGVLLSIWSAYAGGALGFLSTFPEYVTAAIISVPILKKLHGREMTSAESADFGREAEDMVTATALAYRSSHTSSFAGLEEALSAVAASIRILGECDGRVSLSEYRDLTIECAKNFCRDCPSYQSCVDESPAPCVENIDVIAGKLYKRERLFADDSSIVPKYCHNAAALFEKISDDAAQLESERYKSRKVEAIAEEYELFSKLIKEVRNHGERERTQDTVLGDKLTEAFCSHGISGGVVKVFGDRKKHFIGAGEDRDGSLITSSELHRSIEQSAGVRLGAPEYYRKGDIALFECTAAPMFSVEFSAVGKMSGSESVSGDTAISFESKDGHFYSLVADGMGSGESAHKTSLFVADFLSRILYTPCSKNTAFHILNHIIKSRNEECSSTVDLLDFDLITGEALFFKCGAAPSYVKRDGSIFRIRSETAPLGLMKSIDAERIRVEVKAGDYIVMLSDGISQSPEDSTWLLELLSKPAKPDIREYAEFILSEAQRQSKSLDDMTVAVARVIKL